MGGRGVSATGQRGFVVSRDIIRHVIRLVEEPSGAWRDDGIRAAN